MCGWHPGKKQLVLWEFDQEENLYESVMIVQATGTAMMKCFIR
jgi:hypothetical protein